jgi:hypothetical protein
LGVEDDGSGTADYGPKGVKIRIPITEAVLRLPPTVPENGFFFRKLRAEIATAAGLIRILLIGA